MKYVIIFVVAVVVLIAGYFLPAISPSMASYSPILRHQIEVLASAPNLEVRSRIENNLMAYRKEDVEDGIVQVLCDHDEGDGCLMLLYILSKFESVSAETVESLFSTFMNKKNELIISKVLGVAEKVSGTISDDTLNRVKFLYNQSEEELRIDILRFYIGVFESNVNVKKDLLLKIENEERSIVEYIGYSTDNKEIGDAVTKRRVAEKWLIE